MTEDQRTYYTDGEPGEFDAITWMFFHADADEFVPYTGQQIMVSIEDTPPGVCPAAAQVVRLVCVQQGDNGTVLSFDPALVIPRSPRLYRFMVCDMDGVKIG